jgi:hypothetical protein
MSEELQELQSDVTYPSSPKPQGRILSVSIKLDDGESIATAVERAENLGEIVSVSVGPNFGY